MAKKPAKTVNTATTERNKARRLARHVKAHPKDAQSAARVGKPRSVRKAPFVKGSFRKVNKAYRDEAGHVLEAPAFRPIVKKA
ncbi:hypothetical protein FDJ20_gp091 [Vibrio phage Thalassa]|uniref:Uncharacterized protein n=1 Tax=Vibrio phage Thalassa TaxID=2570301 RepID=A0A2H5BH36_9CAUD|nr:hypothetical protein FDJ20_gp091 [Vibrio phage Thalassa]AUG85293.1 hypothetical protein THALASSA_91 [Vibrio phage Thalassa]